MRLASRQARQGYRRSGSHLCKEEDHESDGDDEDHDHDDDGVDHDHDSDGDDHDHDDTRATTCREWSIGRREELLWCRPPRSVQSRSTGSRATDGGPGGS